MPYGRFDSVADRGAMQGVAWSWAWAWASAWLEAFGTAMVVPVCPCGRDNRAPGGIARSAVAGGREGGSRDWSVEWVCITGMH